MKTVHSIDSSAATGSSVDVLEKNVSPRHVAIIMDGNNRWAKRRLLPNTAGHKAGVETIRKVLSVCEQRNVEILTLFAFSSENWLRPKNEVSVLMSLLLSYLKNEVSDLHRRGVRVRFIGERAQLSKKIQQEMHRAEQLTLENSERTLVLAIDYGGEWDVVNATRCIAKKIEQGAIQSSDIDKAMVDSHMSMNDLPKPDLCIRTGGEYRISNFLLWHFAYTELYFSPLFWPDFDEKAMNEALDSFTSRQRRFGKTGDQVDQGCQGA